MVLDGVQVNIAYGDMHTANIATLMDPAKHTHDSPVPSIVVDAKCVRREQCGRIMYSQCADEMILDLELHCSQAPHATWNLLGHYMHVYVNRIFRDLGQDDLASVRERVRSRFDLLGDAYTAAYSKQWSQSDRLQRSWYIPTRWRRQSQLGRPYGCRSEMSRAESETGN